MTTLEKVKIHYDFVAQKGKELNFIVVATVLIGSQNYGVDTPASDVDTYSIIVPTFPRLCKETYTTNQSWDVDNGIAKCRDYRDVVNDLSKQCHTVLEILASNYVIVNPLVASAWNFLKENRNKVYNYNHAAFIKTAVGYGRQMASRVFRLGFSYYDEDLGYNPKVFFHTLRNNSILAKFFLNKEVNDNLFECNSALKKAKIRLITKENIDDIKTVKKILSDLEDSNQQYLSYIPYLLNNESNKEEVNQIFDSFCLLCGKISVMNYEENSNE